MNRSIRKRWDVARGDHASRVARELVTEVLAGRAPRALADDAALLTSELVSNVMRHTAGPCVLTLRVSDASVEIGVTDTAPDLPLEMVHRLPHTVGGFGLKLVDRLANRWGSTCQADSKTVWFQLGDPVAG
jgi:signal transduction histidine kinase